MAKCKALTGSAAKRLKPRAEKKLCFAATIVKKKKKKKNLIFHKEQGKLTYNK